MELSNDFIRHNQNKTLKQLFPSVCDTLLEVGKWYESDFGCIVNYQGSERGYGFTKTGREWYNNNGWEFNKLEIWAPADLSLVRELLIGEAEKRGFVKGTYFSSVPAPSVEKCHNEISLYGNGHNKIQFGHGNGLIFKDGEWAKILIVMTTFEAEAKLNCLIRG